MPPEVKYDTNHPAGATPEARVHNRLRNSGDHHHADVVTQDGKSPTRAFHNIHHSYNKSWGSGDESP